MSIRTILRAQLGSLIILLPVMFFSVYADERANSSPQTILTVSPVRTEISISPGSTYIHRVSLSNTSTSTIRSKVGIEDFVSQDDTGVPRFVSPEESNWSMSSWTTASPDDVTLRPGANATFDIRISAPASAEPGGHYAGVMFTTVPTDGEQTAVVAKIGSLILLSVRGKIAESGILSLNPYPKFVEKGPIEFGLRFHNTGSVHAKPKGSLHISTLFGTRVEEITTVAENVLPQSSRRFSATWTDLPSYGIFFVRGEFTYGQKAKTAATPRSLLFVAPYRLILFFIGVLVIGILIGRFKRKREHAK